MIRENGLTDMFKQGAGRAVAAVLSDPTVSREIQNLAAQEAADVVNQVSHMIPNQAEMTVIGKKISRLIVDAINQNILPQIYNRTRPNLGSVIMSDAELKALYDKGIRNIPANTRIPIKSLGPNVALNLNIRQIVQAGLPFNKFKAIVNKFDPLVNTVKRESVPFVERRAKQVAALAVGSGFIAGALVMLGMCSLYNSFD